MKFKSIAEEIKFYEKFEEGSEMGDGVSMLLHAAHTFNGIGYDHQAKLALLAAEDFLQHFFEDAHNGSLGWYGYDELDSDLYEHFIGEKKMSKRAYEKRFGEKD